LSYGRNFDQVVIIVDVETKKDKSITYGAKGMGKVNL